MKNTHRPRIEIESTHCRSTRPTQGASPSPSHPAVRQSPAPKSPTPSTPNVAPFASERIRQMKISKILCFALASLIVGLSTITATAQVSFPNPVQPLNSNATDHGADDDSSPQLTTDGNGNWIAVWESNNALGQTIGFDYDILFATSDNNGSSWSAPVALNSNATTDEGDDFDPQLTTDGSGKWIAVWHSSDSLNDTIESDYDILYSVSTNNGTFWTAPAALDSNAATDGFQDEAPQITTDGSGTWISVWSSSNWLGGTIGIDVDILYSVSTNNGSSWSAPSALNSNAFSDSGDDDVPQLTTDGSGNWIAVWNSNDSLSGTISTDHDILYSLSTNNGTTWSAPTALNSNASTDSGDDTTPQLSTDSSGAWIAVWQSNEDLNSAGLDVDVFLARSSNNGATWSQPELLNSDADSDSNPDEVPQLSTDSNGNWIATWDKFYGVEYSVSANDGVDWSSLDILNSDSDDYGQLSNEPQITTDGAGNWIAIWFNFSSQINGDLTSDSDILYSVSTNNGGSWSAVLPIDSDAQLDSGSDVSPQLSTDGNGNWVAVWHSNDSLGGTIGRMLILFSQCRWITAIHGRNLQP